MFSSVRIANISTTQCTKGEPGAANELYFVVTGVAPQLI